MKKNAITLFALAVLSFTACKNETKNAADTADAIESTETSKDAILYTVSTNDSKIKWVGTKLTGSSHDGTISLSNGEINVKDGKIENGKFTIDMNSIVVDDITVEDGKEDLEAHLKGTGKEEASDHFFNVKKYPQGAFEITSVTEEDGKQFISGNLTLKEKTKGIKFPATITIDDKGIMIHTEEFTFNRTEFGVNYNSGSVFDGIGDKAINDDVKIKLHIVAVK